MSDVLFIILIIDFLVMMIVVILFAKQVTHIVNKVNCGDFREYCDDFKKHWGAFTVVSEKKINNILLMSNVVFYFELYTRAYKRKIKNQDLLKDLDKASALLYIHLPFAILLVVLPYIN